MNGIRQPAGISAPPDLQPWPCPASPGEYPTSGRVGRAVCSCEASIDIHGVLSARALTVWEVWSIGLTFLQSKFLFLRFYSSSKALACRGLSVAPPPPREQGISFQSLGYPQALMQVLELEQKAVSPLKASAPGGFSKSSLCGRGSSRLVRGLMSVSWP